MLQINELVFDAWGRRFFDDASVTLPINGKVGLVGRNGAGKSTLFKLILGELSPAAARSACPSTPASPRSTRSIRPRPSRCSTRCWPPTSSAPR